MHLNEIQVTSLGLQKETPVLISITLSSNEKVTSNFSMYFPGVKQLCTSGLEIENSPSLRLTARVKYQR